MPFTIFKIFPRSWFCRCILFFAIYSNTLNHNQAEAFINSSNQITLTQLLLQANLPCHEVGSDKIVCTDHVEIKNINDLHVDGENKKLVFTNSRPGKGGLLFVNSNNLVVSNIDLSWGSGSVESDSLNPDERIQTVATVLTCDKQNGGAYLVAAKPLSGTYPVAALSVWDQQYGWPWTKQSPDNPEIYFAKQHDVVFENGRSECIENISRFNRKTVLIRHFLYSNHAITCKNCNSTTIRDVRVTSAPGMGFVFYNGGNGITLENNIIGPECSSQCTEARPSIAADGAHLVDVSGPIIVRHNNFGWQGDDALNIASSLIPCKVNHQKGEYSTLYVLNTANEQVVAQLTKGLPINIYDNSAKFITTTTLQDVSYDNRSVFVKTNTSLPDEAIIVPSMLVPKNISITDNYFHDNRARGVIIGGANALIESNKIERITMQAIILGADTRRWLEGPAPYDVRVIKNKITSANRFSTSEYPSAISIGITSKDSSSLDKNIISKISVIDNYFSDISSNQDHPINFGAGAQANTAGTAPAPHEH